MCFEPPFGGLATTYTVHLRLIGKLIMDFLSVLIDLFSLGVTCYEQILIGIGIFEGGLSVLAKFSHSMGRPSRTIFAQIGQ